MATVKFLYRSTKKTGPITLRFTYTRASDGKTKMIEAKTRIIINKSEWEKLRNPKQIKDASTKNLRITFEERLNKLEMLVLNKYKEGFDHDKEWLIDILNNYYNPIVKEIVPQTLIEYFHVFLKKKEKKIAKRTLTRYGTVYNIVKRFNEETKTNPLIQDVNPDFQQKFEAYCGKENYALSTSNKFIEVIKTVCNDAKQNGLNLDPRYEQIKLKRKKNTIIYLSEEELKQVKKLKKIDIGARLSKARDWLIISCYTGQRVSDFLNFKSTKIRESEGIKLLEIVQQKTGKNVTIPILPDVQVILDSNNNEFPLTLSEQKFNKYIKEVGKLAGINEETYGGKPLKDNDGNIRKVFGTYPKYELITSHIGRRSFATNLYGRFPTPLIMNVTGHSKESTFLDYIGKSSGDMALELGKKFLETLN